MCVCSKPTTRSVLNRIIKDSVKECVEEKKKRKREERSEDQGQQQQLKEHMVRRWGVQRRRRAVVLGLGCVCLSGNQPLTLQQSP